MSRRDVLLSKLSDTMDPDNAQALLDEVIREQSDVDDMAVPRYCRCADPENCTEPIPGYACRAHIASERVLTLELENQRLRTGAPSALVALLNEPHYQGAPRLPSGQFVTSVVMVSAEWYARLKAWHPAAPVEKP